METTESRKDGWTKLGILAKYGYTLLVFLGVIACGITFFVSRDVFMRSWRIMLIFFVGMSLLGLTGAIPFMIRDARKEW